MQHKVLILTAIPNGLRLDQEIVHKFQGLMVEIPAPEFMGILFLLFTFIFLLFKSLSAARSTSGGKFLCGARVHRGYQFRQFYLYSERQFYLLPLLYSNGGQ